MSMGATAFKRGEFRTYRATNKIHLGKYETDILANDEFDYDGATVRYAGMEYGVPQLQGLLGDWFVPVADQTTQYKSKPAGAEVSHATPEARERGDKFTMDEASEEEAVVGTMTEQKQIREAAASGNKDRLEALRQQRRDRKTSIGISQADSNPDAPPPENAADVDEGLEQVLMADEQTYQTAQPVHSSGQATAKLSGTEAQRVAKANEINKRNIARLAAELEEVDPHKTRAEMGGERHNSTGGGGKRVGKGGKYQVIQDDGGEVVKKQYKFSSGAAVGAEGEAVTPDTVAGTNVMKARQTHAVQQGRAVADTPKREVTGAQVIDDPMHTHEPQAPRAAQTTQVPAKGNVGIDEIREGGATGDVDAAIAASDLADLLPGAAVAGVVNERPAPPPKLTEDQEIAEVLDGWNIRRNWQKRVREAVDFYGDWPEAIDAICGKESEKVAEQIRSKLAGA